jgi:hypothetical protein
LLALSFISLGLAEIHIPDRPPRDDHGDRPSMANAVSIDATIYKTLQGIAPSIPSFSANSTEQIYSSLSKKLKFAPYVVVNPNRGSLQTSFSVPLPPNLSPLKSVTFSYDSQNDFVGPFGVGWDIDLPRIERSVRGAEYAPYFVKGLSNSELIPAPDYDQAFLWRMRSIWYTIDNLIKSKLLLESVNTSELQAKAYRPVIDEAFISYLEIKRKSGSLVAFVASKLNGEEYFLIVEGN